MLILLITFAGTPATTVNGGTSLFTNAPAATMLHSPIVTPSKIVEQAPIHTLSPILTGDNLGGYN